MKKILRIARKIPWRKILDLVKKSGGFLTAKGKILDYDEVHSIGQGFMAGLQDQNIEEAWDRDSSRVEDLEWQYYQKGHLIGESLPEKWTIYVAGWIMGFVKASIILIYLL